MSNKIEMGETGKRVIRNVALIRRGRRISLQKLSEQLEAAGRHIPVIGLFRLESGERRVDVDDIVALGEVLGFPPEALMGRDLTIG